jgi:hypothetical protein
LGRWAGVVPTLCVSVAISLQVLDLVLNGRRKEFLGDIRYSLALKNIAECFDCSLRSIDAPSDFTSGV